MKKNSILNTAFGTEAIRMQAGDKVVDELTDQVSNIRRIVKEGSTLDGSITDCVLKIEEILFKRFGFRVEIDPTSDATAAMVMHGFNTDAGLVNIKELMEELAYYKGGIVDKIKKNVNELDKWIMDNGVQVDEDKARIDNLPPKFKAHLLFNFKGLINGTSFGNKNRPLTDREIVAIMMHEIGHAFTFISYSYKTRKTRIGFEDTMRDQLKKGSDVKSAFILAYKEHINPNINDKELANKNIVTVITTCYRDGIGTWGFDETTRSNTDAEFAADQFASRFGLGADLATGLTKISETFYLNFNTTFTFLPFVALFLGVTSAVLQAVSIMGIGLGLIGLIIAALVCVVVAGVIILMLSGWADTLPLTYDSDSRRIERMYNDYIRQLRTHAVSNIKLKEALVKQADVIKTTIDVYKKYGQYAGNRSDGKGINAIINAMFSSVKKARDLEIYDSVLEDVMENSLHLEIARLEVNTSK